MHIKTTNIIYVCIISGLKKHKYALSQINNESIFTIADFGV